VRLFSQPFRSQAFQAAVHPEQLLLTLNCQATWSLSAFLEHAAVVQTRLHPWHSSAPRVQRQQVSELARSPSQSGCLFLEAGHLSLQTLHAWKDSLQM
jgi:hypothetical protein